MHIIIKFAHHKGQIVSNLEDSIKIQEESYKLTNWSSEENSTRLNSTATCLQITKCSSTFGKLKSKA